MRSVLAAGIAGTPSGNRRGAPLLRERACDFAREVGYDRIGIEAAAAAGALRAERSGIVSYTLYNRLGSGGLVVEAALTLANAPFELIELDSQEGTPLPESFRETNPWCQLPTLILPDGSIMTETSAMLVHLALCFPDRHLAPPPGTAAHAAFLRWTTFANVNLYEALVRQIYPFRYTDDSGGHGALRSAANRRMGEALAVVDAHVEGSFLLGDEMTVADIYIAMFFAWHGGAVEVPCLARIARAVHDHPVVGPIWRRHLGEPGGTSAKG